MRVTLALETRFERTPDGVTWSRGWLEYSFWQRYLAIFDAVVVAARVREVPVAPAGSRRADGPGVTFFALPYYVGPIQYVTRRSRLKRAVRKCTAQAEAVILRAPGVISTLVERALRSDQTFGLEVVGDPRDVFGTGGVRSLISPILRHRAPRELRRQCQRACAVAYVSPELRARYPENRGAFATCYSSIDLGDDAYVAGPRGAESFESEIPWKVKLVLVGSLEQKYKGADLLIDALAVCVGAGLDVEAAIVGDGRQRLELESQVRRLGLDARVRFAGRLPPGASIRDELDRADVFVLPSRAEGLPRAMLEAMARGLPCIGTTVGGIPELLAADDLVPPNDTAALAAKLVEVLQDGGRMAVMSARNLLKAREYRAEVLNARRSEFYGHVLRATEENQRHAR